jgi:hypothetical protein
MQSHLLCDAGTRLAARVGVDAVLVYDITMNTVVDSILALGAQSPAWSPAGDALVFSRLAYHDR